MFDSLNEIKELVKQAHCSSMKYSLETNLIELEYIFALFVLQMIRASSSSISLEEFQHLSSRLLPRVRKTVENLLSVSSKWSEQARLEEIELGSCDTCQSKLTKVNQSQVVFHLRTPKQQTSVCQQPGIGLTPASNKIVFFIARTSTLP